MEKIISKFRKNYIYILSFLIISLILYMVMNQVVMYADDFTLKLVSDEGIPRILEYYKEHYLGWGGGLTPLFVTLLFRFGFNVWKILNVILLTVMFYLFSFKISKKNIKKFVISFFISMVFFYLIDIEVARESIYWLDGSMAYVISTFELFLYVYFLYTRFVENEEKKYDWFILPFIGLFSGWSSAQTGALALIITIVFLIWIKFFAKKTIPKKLICISLFSFIGFLIFFLSPGNGVRMNEFAEFSNLNILNKVLYRISDTCNITFNYTKYKLMGVPFFAYLFSILLLFLNIKLIKKNKSSKKTNILKIIAIIQFLYILSSILINYDFINNSILKNFLVLNFSNLYTLKLNSELNIFAFLPYVTLFLFLISNFLIILIYCIKNRNPLLIIIFLVAYGCQFSMILAPYTPYRTCFTTIVFLIFGILYLLQDLFKSNVKIEYSFLLMLLYLDFNLFIIFSFLFLFCESKISRKYLIIICSLPYLYLAITNYSLIFKNYSINKKINNYNIKLLENYNNDSIIYIKKFENELYGFTSLIGAEWIVKDVKEYYNIPENVKITYMEESGE